MFEFNAENYCIFDDVQAFVFFVSLQMLTKTKTMRKLLLISMMLMGTLSSFSQSREELNSKISILSAKVDLLTSQLNSLNEKTIVQAEDIAHLEGIIESMKSGVQQSAGKQTVPGSVKEPVKTAVSGQCIAITKAGSRCSRTAQQGSDYCWQHAKTNNVDKPANTVKTSSGNSNYSGSQNIQTGPWGGRYYINKNGNKTYIKH